MAAVGRNFIGYAQFWRSNYKAHRPISTWFIVNYHFNCMTQPWRHQMYIQLDILFLLFPSFWIPILSPIFHWPVCNAYRPNKGQENGDLFCRHQIFSSKIKNVSFPKFLPSLSGEVHAVFLMLLQRTNTIQLFHPQQCGTSEKKSANVRLKTGVSRGLFFNVVTRLLM